MPDLAKMREHMIDSQLRPNEVNDEKIIGAIRSVNREKFVPKKLSSVAYLDDNIEVSPGRSLMEPMILARMLDAAHVKETDLVLDVGCATGYSSAVLGRLAEAVVALEENEDLAEKATSILAEEDCDNVAVVKGKLTEGLAAQGPYDLIFINGMVEEIPQSLIDQIAEGGRMVCILKENDVGKVVYLTNEGGVVGRRVLFDASVPILQAFKKTVNFIF